MKFSNVLPAAVLAFAFLPGMMSTSSALPSGIENDASRAPRVVIVIRHGEKPPKKEHSPDLTAIGQERAKRIPGLFAGSANRKAVVPHPDALFATHASPGSNREIETLTPLARALNLPLDDRFSEDQGGQLAAELLSGKYAGKVVVICWHHGQIPALVTSLGVAEAPKWADTTFDRIWEVEWDQGNAVMKDLPENLMPGDSQ